MNDRVRPRAPRRPVPFGTLVVALLALVAGAVAFRALTSSGDAGRDGEGGRVGAAPAPAPEETGRDVAPVRKEKEEPAAIATPGPINTEFPGITTFRGNATRTYYGEGPLPRRPRVLWRYPEAGGLCSTSSDLGETTMWCGTGWTGQPNVIERKDGSVEVRIGAFDGNYHFLDGRTGRPVRRELQTGDLAKGSATSDPDGYPLYYAGSRDNYLRIVAVDRRRPEVLWQLNADTSVSNPVWNNDWDAAPLVVGDYLLEGGENSWFYVIDLNRGYAPNGDVTVRPRVVLAVPGFDQELLSSLPDDDVSIESSVAFHDGVAYFANSGGLVQGWNISDVLEGGTRARRVFRFWTGDDTDATIAIDEEGYLYVGSELQRFNARAHRVGQVIKLDPRKRGNPLVWSVPVTELAGDGLGGVWATPAVYGEMVYVSTNHGDLLGIDRESGEVRWRIGLPGPVWSSPVPIDGVLLQGDCAGVLHAYDVSDQGRKPREIWDVRVGGCIESTPAVWRGMIYVGTRSGGFFGIGDRRAA